MKLNEISVSEECCNKVGKDTCEAGKNEPLNMFTGELSKFYQENSMKGVVLIVVHQNDTNLFDINKVMKELINKCLRVRRGSFEDVDQHLTTKENGDIFYKGDLVSIVYYRVGYKPSDYVSLNKNSPDACWNAKRKLELSNAVKIPNVATDLANQKRMQV